MKKLYPFQKATSINEFFKLLRVDLERLRGSRFKVWKVNSAYIDERAGELSFALMTDRTAVRGAFDRWDHFDWGQLAEADLRFGKLPPRLKRWKGYDVFKIGGGNGNEKGYERYARVPLSKLPGIAKLVAQNNASYRALDGAIASDTELRALQAKVAEAQHAQREREKVVRLAFRKKRPKLDIFTGLSVRGGDWPD